MKPGRLKAGRLAQNPATEGVEQHDAPEVATGSPRGQGGRRRIALISMPFERLATVRDALTCTESENMTKLNAVASDAATRQRGLPKRQNPRRAAFVNDHF